jgi:apolipoprotein N-acyltransferase
LSNPGERSLLAGSLAPLAGALVTLSLAPFDLWPAGILSVALYMHLLAACTPRQAAWRGWLYGLGLFGSGASWIYVSIHVHGNASAGLAFALTLLFCAALALLHGLFAWSWVRLVRPLPGGMLLGFPALWVLFEWLRSWLLTGFPWLYLGYAHLDTPIAGWAPIVGVFGLSLICAITASCLFLIWRHRAPINAAVYTVILLTLWLGGAQLRPIDWVAPASRTPLSVALVQPNIPQQQKWDRRYYPQILAGYDTATIPLLGTDLIIWPESAIPNYYQRARSFLDPIATRAAAAGSALITGIPFAPPGEQRYYNSIVALGGGSGVYHKQRLVPFGEYVPLEAQLRGLIAFFDLPMSNFSR